VKEFFFAKNSILSHDKKIKNSLYSISFIVLAVIFLSFEFFRSGDFDIYPEASADLFSSEKIFHKNMALFLLYFILETLFLPQF
jgi:hypothetical protein